MLGYLWIIAASTWPDTSVTNVLPGQQPSHSSRPSKQSDYYYFLWSCDAVRAVLVLLSVTSRATS